MYRVVRPDESIIWFESRISNLLADESVQAVVAIRGTRRSGRRSSRPCARARSGSGRLAASSPLGIVYAELGAGTQYVNDRWREIAGSDADDLLDLDLIHPDDRVRVLADSRSVQREGRTIRSDYRILRPDGEVRHLRSSIAPVADADGVTRGFMGSTEDVTEEVAARGGHRPTGGPAREHARLRVHHRPSRARSCTRTSGRRPCSASGPGPTSTSPSCRSSTPRPAPSYARRCCRSVRQHGVWTGELGLVGVDGRQLPVSIVTLAHHDEYGVVDFFSTIAVDITHLKEVEARLIASESWFRSLVNEALDVVSVRDADNTIVYVSPSVRRVLGYEVEDDHRRAEPQHRGPSRRSAGGAGGGGRGPGRARAARSGSSTGSATTTSRGAGSSRGSPTCSTIRWCTASSPTRRTSPSAAAPRTPGPGATPRCSPSSRRRRSRSTRSRPTCRCSSGTTRARSCSGGRRARCSAADRRSSPTRPPPPSRTSSAGCSWASASRTSSWRSTRGTGGSSTRCCPWPRCATRRASVVSAMGVIVDVTARSSPRTGLRASQERFKALVHHSVRLPRGLRRPGQRHLREPVGRPASPGSTSWTRRPAVARRPPAPRRPRRGRRPRSRASRSGGSSEFEMRMRRHDGAWRWMAITATDLRGDPDVGGVVINSRDVTEAREAVAAPARERGALPGARAARLRHGERDQRRRYGPLREPGRLAHARAPRRVRAGRRRPRADPPRRPRPGHRRCSPGRSRAPGLTGPGAVPPPGRRRHVPYGRGGRQQPRRRARGARRHRHRPRHHRRTRAEEQVRRSEERLLALVQNLSDVITVVDPSGSLVYTSPAANRLFGFVDGDDSWTDPLARVHPDDRDELYERMGEQLAGCAHRTDPVPARGTATTLAQRRGGGEQPPRRPGGQRHRRHHPRRDRADACGAARRRPGPRARDGGAVAAPRRHARRASCELVERQRGGLGVLGACSSTRTGLELRPAAAPNLPTPSSARSPTASRVAEGLGSCGTAAFRREPWWSSTPATDPLFETYRELMDDNGLRACWSTPDPRLVRRPGARDVRGLLARALRADAPADREVVDNLVHLGAIAIERKASEERLAHQSKHDPLTGLPNRVLFLEFLSLALARARARQRNASRCCSSTSTASRTSTTASATTPATSCWSRSAQRLEA